MLSKLTYKSLKYKFQSRKIASKLFFIEDRFWDFPPDWYKFYKLQYKKQESLFLMTMVD